MFDILIELMQFIFKKKKFWLLPIIIVLFIFGFVFIASQGSVVAPFIYTVF